MSVHRELVGEQSEEQPENRAHDGERNDPTPAPFASEVRKCPEHHRCRAHQQRGDEHGEPSEEQSGDRAALTATKARRGRLSIHEDEPRSTPWSHGVQETTRVARLWTAARGDVAQVTAGCARVRMGD